MIQANELRIGNLLTRYGEIVKVVDIGVKHILDNNYYLRCENDNCGYWIDQFKPIQLTEEILLKCGFKHNELSHIYENETRLSIYVNDNFFFCQIDNVVIKDIYYLHQLQNIHFTFTNQELEIQL